MKKKNAKARTNTFAKIVSVPVQKELDAHELLALAIIEQGIKEYRAKLPRMLELGTFDPERWNPRKPNYREPESPFVGQLRRELLEIRSFFNSQHVCFAVLDVSGREILRRLDEHLLKEFKEAS